MSATATGVASSGTTDHLPGNAGNDTITGPATASYFDLSQGGNDTATWGAANDQSFLGAAFTAADTINGGGGNDQIGLQGDYTGANAPTLGATTIATVETIALLGIETLALLDDAKIPAVYDITLAGSRASAGNAKTVYLSDLHVAAGVNGAAAVSNLTIYGGFGNDTIADFVAGTDTIDLPGGAPVVAVDADRTGAIGGGSLDDPLSAALSNLQAGHAVQFTVSDGAPMNHVFEVIDGNGQAGYQPGQDFGIELQTPVVHITDPGTFIRGERRAGCVLCRLTTRGRARRRGCPSRCARAVMPCERKPTPICHSC